MNVRSVILCLALSAVANADDWSVPDLPAEPTVAELLEQRRLHQQDNENLMRYLGNCWDEASLDLTLIRAEEQEKFSREYSRLMGSRMTGGARSSPDEFYKKRSAEIRAERLADPRRIVDAVIRELGRIGNAASLLELQPYVQGPPDGQLSLKLFACIEEMLGRIDPAELDDNQMAEISVDQVAPMLSGLEPDRAAAWAWRLRESHRARSVTFASARRLKTRLWLASSFASKHPQEAAETFREALKSPDAAVASTARMLLRGGLGGSLPQDTPDEHLVTDFLTKGWKSGTPLWEILPLPLDRPFLRCGWNGGRADLVWLSKEGTIVRQKEDVWPLIREPLPNGIFYSRGDRTGEIALVDGDGNWLTSLTPNRLGRPLLARHGGFWGMGRGRRWTEFHADGSVLREYAVGYGQSKGAPLPDGRLAMVERNLIKIHDRWGTVTGKIEVAGESDFRDVVAVAEDRFLVCASETVGWVTTDGKYEPVVSNLVSPLSVRYHPTAPWVVFDGGEGVAVIYDPVAKKETGRFDLDDGTGPAKSRFRIPSSVSAN
ncbi:MAG: hypothetical protein EOP88_15400 [Verrucomicrobiaceae bacterium]|nr:MAG: hypothetical protein EOP88_15400 [Verrucomicrobiaceae bacterium]